MGEKVLLIKKGNTAIESGTILQNETEEFVLTIAAVGGVTDESTLKQKLMGYWSFDEEYVNPPAPDPFMQTTGQTIPGVSYVDSDSMLQLQITPADLEPGVHDLILELLYSDGDGAEATQDFYSFTLQIIK